MACKFFKLAVGGIVRSFGGLCFRRLSQKQLPPPSVSLDGSVVSIYDESGSASEFDILVDGEVTATVKRGGGE